MIEITSLPFYYLQQGEWLNALEWIFSSYIGYGLLYILFGGLIFAIVQTKTKSYGISGMIMIIYSVMVAALLPVEARPFILLFIGILGFAMFWRIWK